MTEVNDNGASRDQEEMQQTQDLRRPGELLRYQREVAGLSQTDVADSLHLTVHYINALESDDYSKLPGLTFVKGYFRAYARFLQMDEDQVVECYERFLQVRQGEPEDEQTYRVRRRNDQAVLWAVAAAAILVIALVCGWWFFGRQSSPAVSAGGAQETAPLAVSAQRSGQSASADNAEAAPRVENDGEAPTAGISYQLAETPDPEPADDADPDSSIGSDGNGADFVQAVTAPDATPGTASFEPALNEAPLPESPVTDAEPVSTAPSLDGETGRDADGNEADENEANGNEANRNEANRNESETEEAPADMNRAAAPAPEPAEAAPAVAASVQPAGGSAGNEQVSTAADGSRQVSLLGEGEDLLRINFAATSWVEVDDAAHQRLYNDLMQRGDELSIRSMAPFYVLLGDATNSEVQLNGELMDLRYRIRTDNSARFEVSADGVKRWVVE